MHINCPHCSGLISADNSLAGQQIACPHCKLAMTVPAAPVATHAQAVVSQSAQRPSPQRRQMVCQQCGSTRLKKGKEAKSELSGCLVVIVGLFLAPILIGIPIVLIGLSMMSKRDGYWACKDCGFKVPRKIGWFEFG